ncbi:putative metal-binding motif-containing protein, partial [Myxococcota bacterium]|nr:putative metal-binding motif-containing protein [Myxococcota bacterium]
MTRQLLFLTLLFTLPLGCKDDAPTDDTGEGVIDADADGFVGDADCDDNDPAVNEGAVEACDGLDNDCDGLVDADDDSLDTTTGATFYTDADADGYGDPSASVTACDAPSGAVTTGDDCDDGDPAVNPGADELCGGGDEDCDGLTDEEDAVDASEWYTDADLDGYGDPAAPQLACTQPDDAVADASDCDDTDETISPDGLEVCDGLDNNCDGLTDDADPDLDLSTASTWYLDADNDGSGDEGSTTFACALPTGYADNAEDCDDGDASVVECVCGDGSDGAYALTTGSDTIEGGVWTFTSFTISPGATLRVTGDEPLVIIADTVSIGGTLDASGGDGLDSGSSTGPDGGDAVGGGGGGGAGGDCGNGNGSGGAPNGGEAVEFGSGTSYTH